MGITFCPVRISGNRRTQLLSHLDSGSRPAHTSDNRILREHNGSMNPDLLEVSQGQENPFLAIPNLDMQKSLDEIKDGDNVLLKAAIIGDRKAIQNLIKEDANLNMPSSEAGLTALHIASFKGHKKAAALLLNAGANPNVQDSLGRYPLFVATVNNRKSIAEQLFAHGANPNLGDNDGTTSLHVTAITNNQKMTSVLLKHGAKVDARDNEGLTPLITSAEVCRFEVESSSNEWFRRDFHLQPTLA